MKLDLICNKQDEYYTPEYAIKPLIKYLKPNSTIYCPFDQEHSNFVKVLKENNFNIIYSHIKDGVNFFDIDFSKYKIDYIISNPPYSIKYEVFEKLFKTNIPFAMLVGVVGLFESKKRFNLFSNNKFEVLYFNKRINYFSEDFNIKYNAPFSSVYITSNIFENQINFEII